MKPREESPAMNRLSVVVVAALVLLALVPAAPAAMQ